MEYPRYIGPLRILGIYARGVPNNERIVLDAEQPVNLSEFGLLVGTYTSTGGLLPFRDRFFWFGGLAVDAGTRVFVYTAPGQFRYTTVSGQTTPAVVYHWGSKVTLFNQSTTTIALIQIGAADVVSPPVDVQLLPRPQNGGLT